MKRSYANSRRLDLKETAKHGGYFNIPNAFLDYSDSLDLTDAEFVLLTTVFRYSKNWTINFSKALSRWSQAKRTRILSSLRSKGYLKTQRVNFKTSQGTITGGLKVDISPLVEILYALHKLENPIEMELLTGEQFHREQLLTDDMRYQTIYSQTIFSERDPEEREEKRDRLKNSLLSAYKEIASVLSNRNSPGHFYVRDYEDNTEYITTLERLSPSDVAMEEFLDKHWNDVSVFDCLAGYWLLQLQENTAFGSNGALLVPHLGLFSNYEKRLDDLTRYSVALQDEALLEEAV
ncbi:MAG: hypothetical protein ACTSWQ_00795 [Candidatus Thorarchaeota archaeon]